MHALIIIRFHFGPIAAEGGVCLARRQASDSAPLVDFYRRCISGRDKCKQGGPGLEGCLKRTVCRWKADSVTRSRFFYFFSAPHLPFFPQHAWLLFLAEGTELMQRQAPLLTHCTRETFRKCPGAHCVCAPPLLHRLCSASTRLN